MNILQSWVTALPLQMQVSLIGIVRGPDGHVRNSPCKPVIRALRGCIIRSAYYGRELAKGEAGDAFIEMSEIASREHWDVAIRAWKDNIDALPTHFLQHSMQAFNILRFKHPDEEIRARWKKLHQACVSYFHAFPESQAALDAKLCDWEQRYWGKPAGYHRMSTEERLAADAYAEDPKVNLVKGLYNSLNPEEYRVDWYPEVNDGQPPATTDASLAEVIYYGAGEATAEEQILFGIRLGRALEAAGIKS